MWKYKLKLWKAKCIQILAGNLVENYTNQEVAHKNI
jgi:hypothetical protein